MGNLLRRVRGAIKMGLTWAIPLSLAGGVARWILGVNTDAPIPILLGAFGFVAGVTFSGLLMLGERRRAFEQMSLARFAAWGAAGGLLMSAVFAKLASFGLSDVFVVAPTFALACAACAAGSLALARRAVRHELPGRRWSANASAPRFHAKKNQPTRRRPTRFVSSESTNVRQRPTPRAIPARSARRPRRWFGR